MRVTEKFEVLDLTPNLSHHIQTANLLPVQYLHRHLVLCQLMLANCTEEEIFVKGLFSSIM